MIIKFLIPKLVALAVCCPMACASFESKSWDKAVQAPEVNWDHWMNWDLAMSKLWPANHSLSNGSPGCKALCGHLRSNAAWNFDGGTSRFVSDISFINFVGNAIYMLIRILFPVRRFFQSLSSSQQSKQKASSAASAASIPQVSETDETQNYGIRRKFLRTLASESRKNKEQKLVQVGGDAREEAQKSMVSFTLKDLLDFQHRARDFAELQHEPDGKNIRKRPNYNNSKRAFFAKGRRPMNHEFLVVQTVRISKLLCWLVFSKFTYCYLWLVLVVDICLAHLSSIYLLFLPAEWYLAAQWFQGYLPTACQKAVYTGCNRWTNVAVRGKLVSRNWPTSGATCCSFYRFFGHWQSQRKTFMWEPKVCLAWGCLINSSKSRGKDSWWANLCNILSQFFAVAHLFFGVVINMLGLEVSEVVGSFNQGRRRWYLMGKRMSPKCVVAVLGLGNFRTNRLLHGRKDRRLRLWGGAHRLQLNMLHSESSKHDDDQCNWLS